jgi:predicted alpha/beta-hydrolase family hydrolase
VTERRFDFDVNGEPSSAAHYPAPEARAALVLAHGAGGRQAHPWMVKMARAIASRGVHVVTFDFLYAHAGRRVPDRAPVLEATWEAVLRSVRTLGDVSTAPLLIGGKSMGGRIATQVAANGRAGAIAGLVLLGYPLHPPGKPEVLRAAHLAQIREPMLFVQGTRDAFGHPDELRPHLGAPGMHARLFVVQGADHSLAVPKGAAKGSGKRPPAGVLPADVFESVATEVARFAVSPGS